ncbi:chaperone NapD [Reinekea blandensis]|uniref:Chaperone NapD n=1 Tax=Reinekea blandensis MED297 TaxID=314283 RepID=A4BGQ8_9GAMM|nr:chaperone NapD [Reinekea blandensis]EAR08706.1 NapD [Reinekea sp. MED297] [Reinekea blandensis MED297]
MKNAVKVTPRQEEEHIVSVIVHVLPEHRLSVIQGMAQLTGVEIVADDAQGKSVLLISAPTAREVMVQIEIIQAMDGVLSAAMIAHHTESADSLNETIETPEGLTVQVAEQ